MISNYFKKIYLKSLLFVLLLICVIGGYIFSLKLYSNNIISKINNLISYKQKQKFNQQNIIQQTELKTINNLIKEKTNQEPSYFISQINTKLSISFEEAKRLILEEFSKNNWQIKTSEDSGQELKITLELKKEDFNKLSNFLISNFMLNFLSSLKIEKNNNIYNVELNFRQVF
jgi:hypothetical protein